MANDPLRPEQGFDAPLQEYLDSKKIDWKEVVSDMEGLGKVAHEAIDEIIAEALAKIKELIEKIKG